MAVGEKEREESPKRERKGKRSELGQGKKPQPRCDRSRSLFPPSLESELQNAPM